LTIVSGEIGKFQRFLNYRQVQAIGDPHACKKAGTDRELGFASLPAERFILIIKPVRMAGHDSKCLSVSKDWPLPPHPTDGTRLNMRDMIHVYPFAYMTVP
jgi:hypothetical protein